jgi:hypothetical protein
VLQRLSELSAGVAVGIPIAGGQAWAAHEAALTHPSLRVIGGHAHRGAASDDAATPERFVREVLQLCDALHAGTGRRDVYHGLCPDHLDARS